MRLSAEILARIPPWDWPPEAGEVVVAALLDRSLDADDRVLAAELASDIIVASDEVQRALIATVRDAAEPEELRAAAAIALGPILEEADLFLFDEPDEVPVSEAVLREVRSTLHSTYADASAPKLVRRRALEASVRGVAEWHESAVRAAFYSGDAEWRLTAIFSMGYVDGFDKELEEALKSDDPAERREAKRARDGADEVDDMDETMYEADMWSDELD